MTIGWQPIETAPKKERVLVYKPSAPIGARIRDDIRLEKYSYQWAHCRRDEQPTHWMPLPEPPQ